MKSPDYYEGREQTYLKHYLLEQCLETVAFHIGYPREFRFDSASHRLAELLPSDFRVQPRENDSPNRALRSRSPGRGLRFANCASE